MEPKTKEVHVKLIKFISHLNHFLGVVNSQADCHGQIICMEFAELSSKMMIMSHRFMFLYHQ